MSATVRVSIRFLAGEHARLSDHKETTLVPTNTFVRRAVMEKLDREGVQPTSKPRRKAKAS